MDADSLRPLLRDPDTGMRFAPPAGWSRGDFGKEGDGRWETQPRDNEWVYIYYSTKTCDFESTDELEASDLEGTLSIVLEDCADEEVLRIIISGNEYWAITGNGLYPFEDTSLPAYLVCLYHIENETLYQFVFLDLTGEQDQSQYDDDFLSFMESVQF